MYTIDNISVYIFNWKKVSKNSIKLIGNIKKYINDITIINCDDTFKFEDSIRTIQLDDSHYYGSQYEHAIFCVIVGDNIPENNFEDIFKNAINIFNTHKVGVYSPNDKRSSHKKKGLCLEGNIYHVANTDCGFWFINPEIVKIMKNFKYGNLSPLGWGVDHVTIMESIKLVFIVIRDYSVETDQIDHTTNYKKKTAKKGYNFLVNEYKKSRM
jgi:hypothetical protein